MVAPTADAFNQAISALSPDAVLIAREPSVGAHTPPRDLASQGLAAAIAESGLPLFYLTPLRTQLESQPESQLESQPESQPNDVLDTQVPVHSSRGSVPATHPQSPPPRLYVAPGSSWSANRIDLAKLLDRTPRPIDAQAVGALIRNKRVLITGAGGSIGSELARIVASFDPSCVILMERAENALFEIDRQLGTRFPTIPRRAVLHDVVDPGRTHQLLSELQPDIVFHAAAHKHVPLMEDHPAHALTNNLFGTKSIADAALAVGAERFVLISSDKAVNPTSVMGATKRLAEMYIQALHRQTHAHTAAPAGASRAVPQSDTPRRTRFSMVRFGNVLGSSCSVVPIWSAQLVDGGPLTITDARMTRYFMTINEAAGLVIQAASINDETHIAPVYVLDMGEPVRILDLACRFLDAHGYAPRLVDREGNPLESTSESVNTVDVLLSGIRPGEKLHEELAYAAEQLRPTPSTAIHAWRGQPADFSLPAMLADLSAACQSTNASAVVEAIRRHVPEMIRTKKA
jgi:O-antigen biosynthesis protein WbqV